MVLADGTSSRLELIPQTIEDVQHDEYVTFRASVDFVEMKNGEEVVVDNFQTENFKALNASDGAAARESAMHLAWLYWFEKHKNEISSTNKAKIMREVKDTMRVKAFPVNPNAQTQ